MAVVARDPEQWTSLVIEAAMTMPCALGTCAEALETLEDLTRLERAFAAGEDRRVVPLRFGTLGARIDQATRRGRASGDDT